MPSAKFFLFGFIILLSIFLSCGKNQQPEAVAVKATLNDFTGLDGCSWVIKTDNNVLEPTNLGEFDIQLVEGKKI